jgi:hypothetical protein
VAVMPVPAVFMSVMIVAMTVTVFAMSVLVRFEMCVPVAAATVRVGVRIALVWRASQVVAVLEVARRLAHVLYSTRNKGVAQPGPLLAPR